LSGDATFSAPKSVSLTVLVGGDDRVRDAHQASVAVALDELERYVQARIGRNQIPARAVGWFESHVCAWLETLAKGPAEEPARRPNLRQ
jgi:hypothetical protein